MSPCFRGDLRNGRWPPPRPDSFATRASDRSCVVTSPIAPVSSRPRISPSAPSAGRASWSRAAVRPAGTARRGRRQFQHLFQSQDLRHESRMPFFERVGRADGRAQRQVRHAAAVSRAPGAPASASTVLTPIVRSSVLLPDMLEPLTTSNRNGSNSLTLFLHNGLRRAADAPFRPLRTRRGRRFPHIQGTGRPDAPTRNSRARRSPRSRSPHPAMPRLADRFSRAMPRSPSLPGCSRAPAARARGPADYRANRGVR